MTSRFVFYQIFSFLYNYGVLSKLKSGDATVVLSFDGFVENPVRQNPKYT